MTTQATAANARQTVYPVKQSEFARYDGAGYNGVHCGNAFGWVQYTTQEPAKATMSDAGYGQPGTRFYISVDQPKPRDVDYLVIIKRSSANRYEVSVYSSKKIDFYTCKNYDEIHTALAGYKLRSARGW